MNGVTILDTYTTFLVNDLIALLSCLFLIIGVVGFIILLGDDDADNPLALVCIINLAIIGLFLFISCICEASYAGKEITHYKVFLDDSVKYVDFVDKYEICDQDGMILDVIEKVDNMEVDKD